MIKFIVLVLFFGLFATGTYAQEGAARQASRSIVLIEREVAPGHFEPHGTGYIFWNYDNPNNPIIVTCAHLLRRPAVYLNFPVIDSIAAILRNNRVDTIYADGKIWLFDGYNIRTEIKLFSGQNVVRDDINDIGAFKINLLNAVFIGKDTLQIIKPWIIAKSSMILRSQVEIGSPIYFLGFPFGVGSKIGFKGIGFASDLKVNPLARGGIVAWKSESSNQFLIDGVSYGGNSGSPVFIQPNLSTNDAGFIGMVLGHLSDPNYNTDTADFNYGLARCIWVDEILKVTSRLKEMKADSLPPAPQTIRLQKDPLPPVPTINKKKK